MSGALISFVFGVLVGVVVTSLVTAHNIKKYQGYAEVIERERIELQRKLLELQSRLKHR
jgi:CHASE3 domain sensor protein